MSGTIWAALFVTAVAFLAAVLAWDSWHRDRAPAASFIVSLPLSLVVNELVKAPIIVGMERVAWPGRSGPPPTAFLLLVLLVAPVVEEAAKLLPLAVPDIRSRLASPAMPFRIGMAAGFGFGLGEAWYLAWGISQTPALASVPFLGLSGYISERIIIAFAHGVMTATSVSGFAGMPSPAAGYATAVALHALVNAGPLAYQVGLIGAQSRTIATLAAYAVLYVVLERMRRTAVVRR